MAVRSGEKQGGVTRNASGNVFEENGKSLPNVLVIGSDRARREWVAHMFHAASFQDKGSFTLLRCKKGGQGAKSEILNLFFALTRDGECASPRTSVLLSDRTLFIDEVEQMDLEGQKLCLEFLKQLQRLKNERPGEIGLRVIAGVSRGVSDSENQRDFLPGLLDFLDKVRIELDPAGKKKTQPACPKHACAGAEA